MLRLILCRLLACALLCVVRADVDVSRPESMLVWPPPQKIQASGPPLLLAQTFSINPTTSSPRLLSAIARYTSVVKTMATTGASPTTSTGTASAAGEELTTLHVHVSSTNEDLNLQTKYDYTLEVTNATATATATTVYGAMYAMETFAQLLESTPHGLRLLHSEIVIRDAPSYQWRGLMIDSGRRFFPMETVKNLLDTMAGTKLNVLHLHVSDMCRFGVESKLYPDLTSSLTGIRAGYYTQDNIRDMISYAKDRGIRVVPEFDIPGHSRGFIPVESQDGVQFCDPHNKMRSQLYGDPDGKTYKIVRELLGEMAALFPDDVFNIGCDETAVTGRCDINSTFDFERKVLRAIQGELGKTPQGWEEVYFDAGAATNDTIVTAWSRHTAHEITATGRRAVESASKHFYFTSAAPGGPKGWSNAWYGIDAKVPPTQKHLLLGGEMSMWSDSYCYTMQCGSYPGSPPVGAPLFDPKHDALFSKSIGGMIWPRGFVAAASFWNYDAQVDPSSDAFQSGIYKINDLLSHRGSNVCPTGCSCDQLSTCGKPYLPNNPNNRDNSNNLPPNKDPASSVFGFA